MDKDKEMTAADIVNTYSPEDLTRVLFTYGEEKFSKQIVKNIVKERILDIFKTTDFLK